MTEFRNLNGNVLIITEINGQLIASYNLEESFVLDGFSLNRVGVATSVPAEELDTLAEPDPSQWIEWTGGNRPVDDDAAVAARLRDGEEINGCAGAMRWQWRSDVMNGFRDIVAYKRLR